MTSYVYDLTLIDTETIMLEMSLKLTIEHCMQKISAQFVFNPLERIASIVI